MTLRIEQSARRINDLRWSWDIWLEPADELAGVERVTYRLHPTFAQPIQEKTNRADKFRLHASGWGEFMIIAEVALAGASEPLLLHHWLKLEERPAQADPHAPKVLVSSGAADADIAESVAMGLDRMGFEAVTHDDLPVGIEFDSAHFEKAFGKLAGAVVVVSGTMSPKMAEELEELERQQVHIVPLKVGGKATLPDRFSKLRSEFISDGSENNVVDAAEKLGMSLKDWA